jgi:hypothetical protein
VQARLPSLKVLHHSRCSLREQRRALVLKEDRVAAVAPTASAILALADHISQLYPRPLLK